ncbi:MAG: HAD-IA family hydrolase [Methylococcales bacterium]|nr:HAD-IA family hydrolase [Methylococcales bacterium]
MNNRFKLIIFDWDGTLVDSIDWIVHSAQTAALNYDVDRPDSQAVKDIIGLSLPKAMTILFPNADNNTLQKLANSYSQEFFSKPMTPQDLFSGVKELLFELKQAEILLAVATGKNRIGLNKALQATQMTELFFTTRCADETTSKPDPTMLEEIMQQANINAEHTLMVGDSSHDLQMALNAHVSAIGVACGAHPVTLLQQYQPLHCLNQTAELLEFIKG